MNTQNSGDNIEAVYPLSPMQQGMLFHSMHAPDTGVYIIQWCCTFEKLNVRAFARAWQAMIDRHSILRTAFVWKGLEEMLQVVGKQVELPWTELDWRMLTVEEQQMRIAALLEQDRSTGFEMGRAPLMRFVLIRLTDEATRFIWSFHHALLDGWSAGTLLRELFASYVAFARGAMPELPPAHRYGEYIEWLQQQDLGAAETFWRRALQGFTDTVKLQFDHNTSGTGQARLEMKLSSEVTQKLVDLSRQQHITLNTVVQGVWALLLNRYSGQDDIVFGMTIAGRPMTLPGAEQMVGLFINTLPLRIQVAHYAPLIPWLQTLQEKQISLHQYQYTPLAQIQAWSQIPKGASLFDSILGFSNYPGSSTQGIGDSPDLAVRDVYGVEQTSYPLGLVVLPGEQLALRLVYDRKCFSEATAAEMVEHMRMLFEGIAAHPEQCLGDLSLLTPEEHQVLCAWNDTQKLYPDEQCFHQLFEKQAIQRPDTVALAFEEMQLTYGALNQCANRLAHFLRLLGVGPEVTVGLATNRSLEMIVGLLGILKAGGAYLPLDPTYPISRLAYIIEDAQLSLIITCESAFPSLPAFSGRMLDLNQEWSHIERESAENLEDFFHQDQLAYVIYTSGTTGRPKGTLIAQRGLRNLPEAMGQAFDMQPGNRALQFASLSFDGSIAEISVALTHGATLHLSTKERIQPGAELLGYLREQAISDLCITPTALAAMSDEGLPALHTIVVAGESCPVVLAARWGRGRSFFNAYGPTEGTVCATLALCSGEEEVSPIGRPISNVQTYVLDRRLRPVPIGVPGELYLGGIALARGYHNRPELTAERFIPNPFGVQPGQRLYRTGDMVRYLPDGRLEFLGRCDEQIKLRGFRIELREIEETLRTHPGVRNAVVVVHEDSVRTRQLVAYFTSEKQLMTGTLRSYLQEWLPDYMIPASFIALPEMPRTPNGKIDFNALPAPDSTRPDLEEALVVPVSHIEQILADIWAEVLYMDEVGIHDNFFSLGGDSILSIQIVSKALEAGIRLTTTQIFEHPTIAGLSAVVDTSGMITAEQESVTGSVLLTPVQQWFFEQHLPNPHYWNMPMLLESSHPLQPELLEQALTTLQDHHDALRLRFYPTDDGWQQVCVAPSTHLTLLQVCDLSAFPEEEQERLFSTAVERCQKSLNISEGPLLQGILFQRGSRSSDLLFLAVHHLAVDGVSWRILLQDLQLVYTQLANGLTVALPAKTTSYRQWSEYLSNYSQAEAVQQERDYWVRQLSFSDPALPVDLHCGPNVERSMASVICTLSLEETQQLLQQVPEVYHTEINDVLLTALVQCLAQWSGSRAITIDLEGHGREELFAELDLSRTVGWFTSFFPVHLRLPEEADPGACLRAIKEQLRQVPRHGIGYGLLRYQQISPEQDGPLPAHSRPQICFNYLGQFNQTSTGDAPLLTLAQTPTGYDHDPAGLRNHLLEMNGLVHAGQLQIAWTYSENMHRASTIERLAEDYIQALRALIRHCLAAEAPGHTPSDFPLAHLNDRQLQALTRLANRLK